MKELKVIKEAALKAYENADDSGKKLLKSLYGKDIFQEKITDRIQKFEDVLDVLGVGQGEWYARIKDLEEDEVVYIQLKLIAEAYNQGWEPDWSDDTKDKWFVWFYVDNLVKDAGPAAVSSHTAPSPSPAYIGSRLAFSCKEHALDAGRKFYELYRSFLIGK